MSAAADHRMPPACVKLAACCWLPCMPAAPCTAALLHCGGAEVHARCQVHVHTACRPQSAARQAVLTCTCCALQLRSHDAQDEGLRGAAPQGRCAVEQQAHRGRREGGLAAKPCAFERRSPVSPVSQRSSGVCHSIGAGISSILVVTFKPAAPAVRWRTSRWWALRPSATAGLATTRRSTPRSSTRECSGFQND